MTLARRTNTVTAHSQKPRLLLLLLLQELHVVAQTSDENISQKLGLSGWGWSVSNVKESVKGLRNAHSLTRHENI